MRKVLNLEQLPCLARGGEPLLTGDHPIAYQWFAVEDLGRVVSARRRSKHEL